MKTVDHGRARELQWEIQQLATAVDYFERVVIESRSDQEVLEHKETLESLTHQLLEKQRERAELLGER